MEDIYKMKKSIFTLTLVSLIFVSSLFSQDEFNFWVSKLKTDKNFQHFIEISNISRQRIEDKYYGDDFQLLKKIEKSCYKDKLTLINCLNKIGFEKSEDFVDNLFAQQAAILAFKKSNPDFMKISPEDQKKLFEKFFK